GDRGIEQRLQIALASPGRDAVPQHPLLAVVVRGWIELHLALPEPPAVAHRPPGEAARGLHDVGLGGAAVRPERVELQQLARVVLVGAFARRRTPVGTAVEVPEHRRAQRGGGDQVTKSPQRMAANHLAVVGRLEPGALALARVDVEVVAPELDHHLPELPSRVRGAEDARAGKPRERALRLPLVELTERLAEGLEPSEGAPHLRGVLARGRELLLEPAFRRLFRTGRACAEPLAVARRDAEAAA